MSRMTAPAGRSLIILVTAFSGPALCRLSGRGRSLRLPFGQLCPKVIKLTGPMTGIRIVKYFK